MLKWRDELDPHYAKLWLDFIYSGMYVRGILDDKTRHALHGGGVRGA